MGLGINQGGVGVARFLAHAGAHVLVTDLKTETELATSLQALEGLHITYVLGKHRDEDFINTDLIIRNPAVPDTSPFLKIAHHHHVPIDTDMGLFFALCHSKNIIGVTGTKGKSTTSALIAHIFKAAGKDVVLAGNIGISVLDALEKITPTTTVVLELSSFSLEGLAQHKTSPHTAVITNIMPDHLNRYENFAAYVAAKALILKYQTKDDIAVLNADDKESAKLHAHGKVLWYKGTYMAANKNAATSVAHTYGISEETIAHAITTFKGLPHRMELIAQHHGVHFINDSAATNPSATVAALHSFTEPVFLIMGGQDKNLPMEDLARTIAKLPNIQKVLLLTHPAYSASEKLLHELEKLGKESMVVRVKSMEEAVREAKLQATSHKLQATILMSPAAASFGMFVNEFDRGNKFKEAVYGFIS